MSDKLYYKERIKKAAENHKWHNEPLNNMNMDIKHGDIITLDNGDTVKVSLEVIKQKDQPKCTCEVGHPYNNICCKVHGWEITQDQHKQAIKKDLNYYKENCEKNYMTTPISVLRYITQLEEGYNHAQTEIEELKRNDLQPEHE
jgi:hypothetical protein